MDKANLLIPKEKFMKVIGETIKLMDMVYMSTLMEQDMRVFGDMIYSMVKVKKRGQMAQYSWGSMQMAKKMEEGSIYGLMEHHTKEIGKKMRLQAMVFINGLMGVSISVTGKAILWMVSVFILGKMAECMKAIT